MAVWQFELSLEPNRRVQKEVLGDCDNRESATLFNCPDKVLLEFIDSILPRRDSWSSELLVWGHENGNRIHLVLVEGKVVEVTIRLDVRQRINGVVEQIVGLAAKCDAHFRSPDDVEIPADKDKLLEAIQASDSYRLSFDPIKYFDMR